MRVKSLSLIWLLSVALLAAVMVSPSQTPSQTQQPAAGTPSTPTSSQGGGAGSVASPFGAQAQPAGLNIVGLDPAHGGTDPGAPGTGGIPGDEIVLGFSISG